MTTPASTTTNKAWAYLGRVIEGPSRDLQALLAAGRTAEEIAHGVRTRATWIGRLANATESRYAWDRPAEDLETAHNAGYSLLTPESPGWPSEQLRFAFGNYRMREESGEVSDANRPNAVAPHVLWVKGATDLAGLCAQSVAFVGTRAISDYGRVATSELVHGLAKQHYSIVSGGALGVDTIAHEAALAACVPTIAVAACGPGVTYPKRNHGLFERIADNGGALITEYPPGMTPDRHRFLTRNRLVAALTQGSVIVEAAFRSGALNTLSWANDFGRVTMAVPGPITGPGSMGTNLAIRDARAAMVLSANHIHELLSPIGTVDSDAQIELDFAGDLIQSLSRNELRVYDSLPQKDYGGSTAEAVAARAGLTIGLTVHLLVDLSKRGIVTREAEVWKRT
ncbi:DNA-processing protein DprA [Corynebacterium aquatimens]|uniref:DNA processing protein n=1 Tax=Corynebacterium aquatimens TaxID=1190508 RepID=A0A931E3L4_9CORY|nr:DNA-processing protein DprA [Corynebacterium aquatimens]MBG6121878.1 DNA processing protein [Corynebacterium aquatimens]WJY65584.1 hypothetical protein CAQUA_04355 [Corynebacterium aquatimens]